MKLYFLRHGSASDVASNDDVRPLTGEGEEEAHVAGKALGKLGAKPARIFSSPLLRAEQTAKRAAKALDFSDDIETLDELKNGATTAALLRALKNRKVADDVLLVGHMPSLAEHIAALIGAKTAEGIGLGKGSVACVELDELRTGTGELRWLMRQGQLREIAG